MSQIQSIDELIGLLVRRRLLIGVVAVFGIVMTLLYVMSKPDVFESTAVIQVQSPNAATTDTTTTTPRENSAQRLQTIQQQLTTRENMLAVIARHGLFAGTALTDDEKVHLLRIGLRFETVASAASAGFGQPSEVSALLISAQAGTRAQAARVANDFAQGILDAGANSQAEQLRQALSFFRQEEVGLKAQIDTVSSTLAEYQTKNLDALPAQRDSLRIELTGIETELRSLDQSLVAARNDRAVIDRKQVLRVTDSRQLDSLIAQIETQSAQAQALEVRRAEILATLAKAQDFDRTIDTYQRNLTQLQSQYAEVARKSASAETDAKLQDLQQSETFTMLERAAEPDYPISGGRRKLAMAGVIASLVVGLIAAFILDHIRPVLRTRSHLERELDLRPIVAIPEVKRSDHSLREWIKDDLPKLSNFTLGQNLPALSARTGIGPLGRPHAIIGGVVIIVIVAIAATMA
ncbi:Wzz/FepE/Etk N-terminal domain-containing protein [Pseudorhodobacter sp. W20_MBD10_FR17]|uniref:Wzz/FepE/Etk N-terminal domain-containing protein n=1 Tax=Pseudorhodobacter sp. W20_MBD10_FR17 TaxID=3240266 RepID=UPI003F9DBE1D